MYFLTGEYDHQIDSKNRIRIPSKLKGSEEKLYFARGTDECIFVFYEKAMQEKLEVIEKIQITNYAQQKGLRRFTKSIKLVEVDNQGRLVIPQELVDYAHITKDVKICGAGARIEIWAKEVYDKYFDEDEESYDDSLGKIDF